MGERAKVSRRGFLLAMAAGAAAVAGVGAWVLDRFQKAAKNPLLVNDMHSKLNETLVSDIQTPGSFEDVVSIMDQHRRMARPLSICGSRHAMGGQQFAVGTTLVDTRGLNRVLDLDEKTGIVHTQAGIEWPDLVDELLSRQKGRGLQWTIPTKQTGADKLTLGGAISVNAHGRGLTRKPIGADIESLLIVNAQGEPITCSRTENPELFSLVIGGYGLFGIVHSLQMRLVKREKIERRVVMANAAEAIPILEQRIKEGFTLGDWQYAIDENSDQFLNLGVLSCYRPVDMSTPIPDGQKKVSTRAWNELVYLAHTQKSRAFQLYSDYYLKTDGQVYWSDTSQLGGYDDGYHKVVDNRMHAAHPATEMITELYVPRSRFADFMHDAAATIRKNGASVIYGTVRLILKDEDSFLRWAKEDYACVIFNLHVEHTPEKIQAAAGAFRDLIDLAIARGGSYYLTYHRWARKDQVLTCYPQFKEFLKKKLEHDPSETFQSDWYRHYKKMFV